MSAETRERPAVAGGDEAAAPPPRPRRRDHLAPSLWFAVPALLVYLLIVIYPSLSGVMYAFTDWTGMGDELNYVGLDNLVEVFTDDQSFSAVRNAVMLTVFVVVAQNVLGLLLALGVHVKIKSRYLLRAVFFAPVVVSPVVLAFLWKYLYNPAPNSGVNALLGAVGLDALQQDWLGDPDIALWAVAFTVVWQFAGYSMVIYLAALEAVPLELQEAAALDGAGRFARFRHIVFPLIGPAITISVMLSTISGLKIFDQVFAITAGGPGYATEVPSTLIYKQAFVFGNYGYSTAIALVLSVFVAAVAFVQLHYLRRREVTV